MQRLLEMMREGGCPRPNEVLAAAKRLFQDGEGAHATLCPHEWAAGMLDLLHGLHSDQVTRRCELEACLALPKLLRDLTAAFARSTLQAWAPASPSAPPPCLQRACILLP